ncbi:MAG: CaiB/BaiF CoA transferase family protein [Nocardioides sp.]
MGPLEGIKVVEIAGIGPGPHACMTLADLGADVIRIERPGGNPLTAGPHDLLSRGRPSVALDLKNPDAAAVVLDLVSRADALIEGMRPGVAERLGFGPAAALARNPALVYGRMTGWGQSGPLADSAGHDLTYLATSGVLATLGQSDETPQFPVNLLGDFGGGSTYLVIGVLAAIISARATGAGQVVDAAIIDGVSHLDAMSAGLRSAGLANAGRGQNLLDGGVPFYSIYTCADGRHLAVGCLEPQFFAEFINRLGVQESCPGQGEVARYDEMRELFATTLATRTRDQWTAVFEGTDSCVAGVLTPAEAQSHPHVVARDIWQGGQPAPAPRFSETKTHLTTGPSTPGADTTAALTAWGVHNIEELLEKKVAIQA